MITTTTTLLAEKYKKIFFLQDDDILQVQQAGNKMSNNMDAAFMELYAWIELQTDFDAIFTEDILAEISKIEQEIWLDLLLARVDEQAIDRQRQLAQRFQRFGVPFEVYLNMLVALHEIIENIFIRKSLNTFDLLRSFKKVAGIHISIVIDAYNDAYNETLRAQNAVIMDMSAPITKIWDKILFLPLVGLIDSRRSENIMVSMLQHILQHQSKVFILDISGIAAMDTAVANYLIQMTKAAKLMGCRCILSGISPSVAQTMVSLGIQEEEVNTVGNLQDALKKAFQLTGIKIKKK